MKNILLASTAALVLTAGYAAAEVTVTGDARMGVLEGFDFAEDDGDLDDFDDFDDFENNFDLGDVNFTSRIRIRFAASGETDGGLTFGGAVRVDNYEQDQATLGQEGSVFVSGAFGKLSMGDVSGAAESAVGDLSGVGLTGLGDFNENVYLSNDGGAEDVFDAQDLFDYDDRARPAALYEYTTGDLTFFLGADNPGGVTNAMSVGAKYTMNNFTFGLGYEQADFDDAVSSVFVEDGLGVGDGTITVTENEGDAHQLIAGVSAGFGAFTLKGVYGQIESDIDETVTVFPVTGGVPGAGVATATSFDGDGNQWGLSADYVMGATTITAFYRTVELDGGEGDDLEIEAYGLGAAYDLGGGASLKGGIVSAENDFAVADGDSERDTAFDFGISMAF